MDAAELKALADRAQAIYDGLSTSQRLRHDYMQRRSFARGMCPDSRDFEEHCRKLDERMPHESRLTDAQIGLILMGKPWRAALGE